MGGMEGGMYCAAGGGELGGGAMGGRLVGGVVDAGRRTPWNRRGAVLDGR
jgi:hypothetical protein